MPKTSSKPDAGLDLARLADVFDEADLEWKPVAVSKKTGKALVAPYVTNRAVMDRLDEVVGPANWKNEFAPGPGGGVICGLSIRIEGEWVTKWDGSENTDIEPIKGGLSTAMRRAAVQWGIGRYLYSLDSVWHPIDEHGRLTGTPRLKGSAPEKPVASATKPSTRRPAKGRANGKAPAPDPASGVVTPEQVERIVALAREQGWSNAEMADYAIKTYSIQATDRVSTTLAQLTSEQADLMIQDLTP